MPITCIVNGVVDIKCFNLLQEIRTNKKGRYKMGEYTDKELSCGKEGVAVQKGERVGGFNLGSSIVLIFEAPKNFQFNVIPGQRVFYGQPLGKIGNGVSS